jgi:methyl-accepting chemotaxis protein
MISIVGLALWLQNEMAGFDDQEASVRQQVFDAAEVRSLSRAIQRDVLKSATDTWDGSRAGLEKSIASRSEALLSRAKKLSKTFGPSEAEMGQFLPLQERFLEEIAAVRALVSGGNTTQARAEILRRVEPAEKAASHLLDGYIERGEKNVAIYSEKSSRFHATAPIVLLTLAGLSLVVALGGAAAFVSRGIIRPLRDVEGAVGKMAAGDYEIVLRGLDRKDELGSISRAIGGFRDGLASGAQLRLEQARLQQQTDEERARNEAARDAAAKEQAFVVSSIGEGLEQLAKGDLTFRLSEAFPTDYRKLQDDFNAAMGTLQETMKTISGATEGIRSGTGEVSQGGGRSLEADGAAGRLPRGDRGGARSDYRYGSQDGGGRQPCPRRGYDREGGRRALRRGRRRRGPGDG